VDVSIVVGTFGDPKWADLARTRAIPSAEQFGVRVIHEHADTLDQARNAGLWQVDTEWVCHLDADDELEPGYFDAMSKGTADCRAPRVRYIRRVVDRPRPIMPRVAGHTHDCNADCLAFGNWLVVGSLASADACRIVGGWRDFHWSEDWDLWVRLWKAGCTFEAIPDAIYRAHVDPQSRNRGQAREAKLAAHRAIAVANELPVPA
jgi:GT2 family glycosyltransferase